MAGEAGAFGEGGEVVEVGGFQGGFVAEEEWRYSVELEGVGGLVEAMMWFSIYGVFCHSALSTPLSRPLPGGE